MSYQTFIILTALDWAFSPPFKTLVVSARCSFVSPPDTSYIFAPADTPLQLHTPRTFLVDDGVWKLGW